MSPSSIEPDRVGKQIVSCNGGVRLVRHGLALALLAVVLPCGVVSVSNAAPVANLGARCVGDYDASGFDECFPTIGACAYPEAPWQGVIAPDHGELWTLPWAWQEAPPPPF